MTTAEQQALLTIALLAAFSDGDKADTEREAIRRMAESLGHEAGGAGLAQLYQDVLLKRTDLASAAQALSDPGQKHLAYEMASVSATPMAGSLRPRLPFSPISSASSA